MSLIAIFFIYVGNTISFELSVLENMLFEGFVTHFEKFKDFFSQDFKRNGVVALNHDVQLVSQTRL